ncbi:HlyD family type I secretion periplasmic adaptor subunit [Rhizobium sp. TRM95001]|nr:HlyD family type I secretion periplasmic adaptor subunit [Rhizobium halophilum]
MTLSALGIGSAAALSASVHISGAVIASGRLVVESHIKPVQHLRGGIVSNVAVSNGDHVSAGDMLLQLDGTQVRATYLILSNRVAELRARISRLEAEQSGQAELIFSDELIQQLDQQDLSRILAEERRLFEDRRRSREGRKRQLQEQIYQLKEEMNGLIAQRTAKQREIDIVNEELSAQRRLLDRAVVTMTRIYALEREGARLSGELGRLTASTAQTKGRVTETELQIIQIDDALRSDVSEELDRVQTELQENAERLLAAQDELQRIDLRAPQDGTVHQLTVHASGSVVAPGETVMHIVPSADQLLAEVRIAPHDIDQVSLGQKVLLRLSSFSGGATPELKGGIAEISAELATDTRTGANYYLARVRVEPEEWRRLEGRPLIPGMPAEAFVQTEAIPLLSYFAKPLADQFRRAFREG